MSNSFSPAYKYYFKCFSPALPILTKDVPIRYPNNKVLITDLYGLKRRLFKEEDEYLDLIPDVFIRRINQFIRHISGFNVAYKSYQTYKVDFCLIFDICLI